MAAARQTSIKQLQRLAAGSIQARQLHITGPATYPSPFITTNPPATNVTQTVAGLRAECKKRNLPTNGSKAELMKRLSIEDNSHARSFTTAIDGGASKRPAAEPSGAPAASQPVRHFNTSRALKAVNDSSTIDFAYLPDFDVEMSQPSVRVPLLPENYAPMRTGPLAAESEESVMRPTINTISADSTFIGAPSAMSEVHDNGAMDIDYQGMASRVAAAAKRFGSGTTSAQEEQQVGTIKEVWNGLLDDIFGPAKAAKA